MLNDNQVILTLDAGGTNFHFSAYQNGAEIIESFSLPAEVEELSKALETLVNGFKRASELAPVVPAAISFAFPGPADYENGIINNVGNLPAFAGGVALGPYLEEQFNIPVFINNDGDLYAYGEGRFGILPWVNQHLSQAGSSKRFKSLVGLTLGTGYGAGAFLNGHLHRGDNSAALEVWTTRNGIRNKSFTEEGVSKRALINHYGDDTLTPEDLYLIAIGERAGNQQKAQSAFFEFGNVLGESIADLITLFDGVIAIGGGLSQAHTLFMPTVLERLRGKIQSYDGVEKDRIVQNIYYLEDDNQLSSFAVGSEIKVQIPDSEKTLVYDSEPRVGIALSKLGASRAIELGAYAYAIDQLKGRV